MSEWTDDAKVRLEEYLGRVSELCAEQGDDAEEVVDDLRTHLVTEAEREGGDLVTARHLDLVFSRVGTPEQVAGGSSSVASMPKNETRKTPMPAQEKRGCLSVFMTFFMVGAGIVLPALALVVELIYRPVTDFFLIPYRRLFTSLPLPVCRCFLRCSFTRKRRQAHCVHIMSCFSSPVGFWPSRRSTASSLSRLPRSL